MPKTTRPGLRWLSARTTDDLYALLEEIAEREQRSLSNLTNVLILEALRARGEAIPAKATPPEDRRSQPRQVRHGRSRKG